MHIAFTVVDNATCDLDALVCVMNTGSFTQRTHTHTHAHAHTHTHTHIRTNAYMHYDSILGDEPRRRSAKPVYCRCQLPAGEDADAGARSRLPTVRRGHRRPQDVRAPHLGQDVEELHCQRWVHVKQAASSRGRCQSLDKGGSKESAPPPLGSTSISLRSFHEENISLHVRSKSVCVFMCVCVCVWRGKFSLVRRPSTQQRAYVKPHWLWRIAVGTNRRAKPEVSGGSEWGRRVRGHGSNSRGPPNLDSRWEGGQTPARRKEHTQKLNCACGAKLCANLWGGIRGAWEVNKQRVRTRACV